MQDEFGRNECGDCEATRKCVIFIDGSNIFIEGQKYYARRLSLLVPQDPRCRIDIGNLVDLAMQGRPFRWGKLYSSESPALDTVWYKFRKHLHVVTSKRNSKGKHEGVHTALAADAIDYTVTYEHEAHETTIIIIAGDRDYLPLVNKILSKQSGWKIELIAFQNSICKGMNKINDESFQVITLESLFEENTYSICYINAQWRNDLYRIPRSRTIVLQFKVPLISDPPKCEERNEVYQRLKKCADDVTFITGVPCFYHLCKRNPHLVFFIGFTKRPDSTAVDFIGICKQKEHQLTKKFQEISKKDYEKFTTLMEIRDASEDVLQVENKFSVLDIEDNELRHIGLEDDDDDGAVEASEFLDDSYLVEGIKNLDSDRPTAVSGEEGYTELKSSKGRKHAPKYSTRCTHEFRCFNGTRCDYTHAPEEVAFFKANNGKGCKGYKSKPCTFHWRDRGCKHGKDKATVCSYYHSEAEARCNLCKNEKLEYIGHAAASHSHD